MGGISFNNFKLFFQFCIWDNLQVLLNSSSTVLLWAYNFVIWGHLHGKTREMLWFFVFITLLFSNVVVWGDIRAYHMIPVKRLKIRTLSSFEYDCFKNLIVGVIQYSTNHNTNRENGMLLFFEVYLWKWAGGLLENLSPATSPIFTVWEVFHKKRKCSSISKRTILLVQKNSLQI